MWEKNTNYVAIYKPRTPTDRRRLSPHGYQFKPRSQGYRPSQPSIAPTPPSRFPAAMSPPPRQALNLLNSDFVIRQAAFAERLRNEAGPDPAGQAERAFQLAFGRRPSRPELAAAVALINDHGSPRFAALYNANEFVYVP